MRTSVEAWALGLFTAPCLLVARHRPGRYSGISANKTNLFLLSILWRRQSTTGLVLSNTCIPTEAPIFLKLLMEIPYATFLQDYYYYDLALT